VAEASDSLRTVGTRLSSLHEDAELALGQVASRSSGVNAMRAALRSSIAEHSELIARVGSLQTATAAACDGLIAVRRQVLACQDYADANPNLSLANDGTVTAILPTTSNTTAATAATTTGGSAGGTTADAKLIQSQADELAGMVAATVTLANQVDADYAQALNAVAPTPPGRDSSSYPGQWSPSGGVPPRVGLKHDPGKKQFGKKGEKVPEGLGEPVPGEHAEMPGVNPWQYSGDTDDEGSGEHGQRDPGARDYLVRQLALDAAAACSLMWPDAAANLEHYLGNSGEPKEINVDGMLDDLPSLDHSSQEAAEVMVGKAVADAQASGVSEPVTYPFNTQWESEYAHASESQNWFYATGGYQYCTDGTVTVYPPTDSNPEWTYSYDYRVHVADRYNWDGNKETKIFGVTITDKQLQELHQAGIAQEYDLVGESSVQHGNEP